jgi:phospholipase C
VPAPIARWHPSPPTDQQRPRQEKGRRPARAVAYQPAVSGGLVEGALGLRLANTGRRATSFTVYSFAETMPSPTWVPVDGGQVEVTSLPVATEWDVLVQGPNRFWCRLVGSAAGAAAGVDVRPTFGRARAALGLTLVNDGTVTVTLELRSLAYKEKKRTVRLAAGAHRDITWPTDHGWYDVQVTAPADASFRRHLTGRVETGRPTVTA